MSRAALVAHQYGVLKLDLRLGEGSGAVLAWLLLESAWRRWRASSRPG